MTVVNIAVVDILDLHNFGFAVHCCTGVVHNLMFGFDPDMVD